MEEQLLNAANIGDVSTIRRLVAEGADVNVSGPREKRPLHFAALEGHVDAVRVLVEAGAEVEAPAADGVRPLYLAAKGGIWQW
jgi:ankyrin repeat protein